MTSASIPARMSDSTAFPVRSAIPGMAKVGALSKSLPVKNTWSGPWAVWSRMLVTLAVLMAHKVLLIVGFSHSLYEAHWRYSGIAGNWLNYVGFCGFILIGGLALVRLAKECQSLGTASVRAVNAAVLVLGLSFILLTFHNGDKNFFYPVLSGVLKWTSLGPYLANALFFNQPFLAGWLFVYAMIYYVLARTGRERLVLFVTTAFGCIYALIYLQELVVHRNELLLVDCLGLISLLAVSGLKQPGEPADGGFSPPRFRLAWLLVPLAWIAFFCWALLRFGNQWHSHMAVYFLLLLMVTTLLFGVTTVWVGQLGRSQSWGWLLAFFVTAFFLLADRNYPSAINYNHLLCLALTFPRYFMGSFAVIVVLGLAGTVYCRLKPRAGLWWMDVAALALIVFAGVDLRLSQIMGVRLGWDVLNFADSPTMMLRMAKPYLPAAIVGLLVLIGLYALALRGIRFWVESRASTGSDDKAFKETTFFGFRLRASGAPGFVLVLFVCWGVLGLWLSESDKAEAQSLVRLVRNSPLWKRISRHTLGREEFLATATALGLGDLSRAAGTAPVEPRRDLNVVVVFMESSYNKHLSLFGSSEDTEPLLSKYKDRMELFPNFFSAFAGSIYARFATFTSLYPTTDFHRFTQDRVPVKSLFEVLHDQGYSCSMFYSSYFDYTGFRDFLKKRGFDEMYDADTMPGQRQSERVEWGLPEEETLGAIRQQIQKYAHNQQRFCLTYVPAAPHYPYDKIPKRFEKYQLKEIDDFKPRYLNELLYMDWVIASIIDELKETGLLEQTLVVITNDHGEMLGGPEGHIGHGWAITPTLANTPLILMDPQRHRFQINKTIGTQVDLLPTILDRLNIPVPADQLYEGLSLDAGPARAGRLGYLNSLKQFGIITGDQIALGDREIDDQSEPAARGAAYTIANDGAKTLFNESDDRAILPNRRAAIERFDAFQENFLSNYEIYCRAVRGLGQQTKN